MSNAAARISAVASENARAASGAPIRRVAVIGSPQKPAAVAALDEVRRWVQARADLVFADITFDSRAALAQKPELLIVLGGDGTLISAAHRLERDQIPILGVNLGKLGFLADFTLPQLETFGDFLFTGPLPISRRLMLNVRIENGDAPTETLAVNDCVVVAGPPFRMIQMTALVDGDEVARVRGDGLIVATPTGSTAHNLSAGGPIVEPTATSMIVTPICPHALTFRPLVLSAEHELVLTPRRTNPGTHVVIDGRTAVSLHNNDRVIIRRYPTDFLLVRNPRDTAWTALRRKLMWGAGPVAD